MGILFHSHDEKPLCPDNCESWEQKRTDYYVVIFDFERDIFRRKLFCQLYLFQELRRIGATKKG
jgi:hypothetical protein